LLGQKKVSKEKATRMPLIPRAPKLSTGVAERGFLPLRQRAASLRRPYGLIPSKAPVLGAAYGGQTLPGSKAFTILLDVVE